tara:strand:- start:1430 stop:1786 length:357 start_codon:yes stop_codon:yes gene_type:complete
MKQFFTLTFLFLTFSILSQEATFKADKKDDVFTAHNITYTVNSLKELKSIDWKVTKDLFKENKPEALIELAFEIDLPDSETKFKSTFTVGGKTKDIDSLIKKIKKGVKSIYKLASNYK